MYRNLYYVLEFILTILKDILYEKSFTINTDYVV